MIRGIKNPVAACMQRRLDTKLLRAGSHAPNNKGKSGKQESTKAYRGDHPQQHTLPFVCIGEALQLRPVRAGASMESRLAVRCSPLPEYFATESEVF
jgi:hypothetical protein